MKFFWKKQEGSDPFHWLMPKSFPFFHHWKRGAFVSFFFSLSLFFFWMVLFLRICSGRNGHPFTLLLLFDWFGWFCPNCMPFFSFGVVWNQEKKTFFFFFLFSGVLNERKERKRHWPTLNQKGKRGGKPPFASTIGVIIFLCFFSSLSSYKCKWWERLKRMGAPMKARFRRFVLTKWVPHTCIVQKTADGRQNKNKKKLGTTKVPSPTEEMA